MMNQGKRRDSLVLVYEETRKEKRRHSSNVSHIPVLMRSNKQVMIALQYLNVTTNYEMSQGHPITMNGVTIGQVKIAGERTPQPRSQAV